MQFECLFCGKIESYHDADGNCKFENLTPEAQAICTNQTCGKPFEVSL